MTDSWVTINTPNSMLIFFTAYLTFVLKIGPRFMEDRKPFKILNIIRTYNVFQVLACTIILRFFYSMGYNYELAWKCGTVDEETQFSYWHGQWYILLFRAFEFSETIFFVLRKKQNQVSFLHVYHHMSVVTVIWMGLKYFHHPNQGIIIILNSLIHTVMYTYYFLSSFESLKRYTKSVKPMITIIQITQLVILFIHCIKIAATCGSPALYYLHSLNLLVIIFQFGLFYSNSYLKKISITKER